MQAQSLAELHKLIHESNKCSHMRYCTVKRKKGHRSHLLNFDGRVVCGNGSYTFLFQNHAPFCFKIMQAERDWNLNMAFPTAEQYTQKKVRISLIGILARSLCWAAVLLEKQRSNTKLQLCYNHHNKFLLTSYTITVKKFQTLLSKSICTSKEAKKMVNILRKQTNCHLHFFDHNHILWVSLLAE